MSFSGATYSRNVYSQDDIPKTVVRTLNQGSNVMSLDFHPMHHTILLGSCLKYSWVEPLYFVYNLCLNSFAYMLFVLPSSRDKCRWYWHMGSWISRKGRTQDVQGVGYWNLFFVFAGISLNWKLDLVALSRSITTWNFLRGSHGIISHLNNFIKSTFRRHLWKMLSYPSIAAYGVLMVLFLVDESKKKHSFVSYFY